MSILILVPSEPPAAKVEDEVSVLVERVRLNHKKFNVRMNVNSESAKTVIIRSFLGPKYDSLGNEIPLDKNWHQFFLFDVFSFDCEYFLSSYNIVVSWIITAMDLMSS